MTNTLEGIELVVDRDNLEYADLNLAELEDVAQEIYLDSNFLETLTLELDSLQDTETEIGLEEIEDLPSETQFDLAITNTAGNIYVDEGLFLLLTPPLYKNSIQAALNNLKSPEPYIDLTGQIKLGVYNTNTHLTLNLSVPFSYLRRAF